MRPNLVTRTLVSLTTVVGIAAGTLAGASTSFAASESAQQPQVVAAAPAAQLATVNLGLSTNQAKGVQRWLARFWGYTGEIDGQLGTNSWKAFQRHLKAHAGYTGEIDGIVGSGTLKALQRHLKASWGYTGEIDADPGPGTRAAFARFANWCVTSF
ncbi:peptidoglycan-binding domain-containing protein [Streptomyces capitiformicae]|uniref:Peptidoglycan-binding protein n=1 Tax=Streptomyces capitiformicae TaxID=2014920 RepID=A0A918ZPX9_9ACTN|nr:peptidoglycan-binding domain-containing protein [Streptomyces capitiformicae]GHE64642.1 hypothetical protein GCM10017771_88180 [Streptomyces capitiformicae]